MSKDVIGDFLTVIRNGIMRSKPFVATPYSKIKTEIALLLKQEGFIKDFFLIEEENSPKKQIKVILKYVDGESAVHEIKRISKPGKRIYTRSHEIEPVIGGLGISILTTSNGIISNKKAKSLSIGGEVICTVW